MAFLFVGRFAVCAQTNQPSNAVLQSAIADWLTVVNNRVAQGANNESDFTDMIRSADDLYATYKDLHLIDLEVQIYTEVVTNSGRFDKAIAKVEQAKKDYPTLQLDSMIAQLKDQAEKDHIFSSLKPGVAMPDFHEVDSTGQPLSLSAHKGKVLIVDFWATWCPPCLAEFPNIKRLYDHFHDKGLDIVGIDLDDDRARFDSFLRDLNVAWPQYYDGLKWSNKVAAKYGIEGLPSIFLLDTNGVILAKSIRGKALDDAVTSALKSK